MTPTILLAHAYLSPTLRARYEAGCPGWRIVPFTSPFPGMSSAYTALAADLRRRCPGPLLAALLRHLKFAEAGPVVMAWYSGGYAMARELAADASAAFVAGWVGIDGMHTGKDGDGTASDAGVEWLVRLARAALVGETVVALGHSDVRTYGTVASTTDVAREVRRLADIPPGDKHGGLILRAYNVRGLDHDEHGAALTEWGPALLGEAVSLVSGVPAPQSTPAPVVVSPAAAWTDPAPDEPLRRGHRGPRVKQAQIFLTTAGYRCDADGLFGPATEAQVKALQRRVGLPVIGVVGEAEMVAVRAAVTSAADPPDPDKPERGTGAAALAVALSELAAGAKEEPAWSNTGPRIRQYLAGCVRDVDRDGDLDKLGLTAAEWCAAFVGWCDAQAGVPRTWRAAVSELCADARAAGMLRGLDYQPRPGDLAIFGRSGQSPLRGGLGHVARVERFAGGSYTTIDGNHGDRVARVERPLADPALVGWIEYPRSETA